MCGIYGRWHRDGAPIDPAALVAAATTLRHRGPDDEGYLLADTRGGSARHYGGDDTDARVGVPHVEAAGGGAADLALAFRRLSIVDLSPLGHQPMRSEDGRYWLVFNGEIYNYRELRAELQARGHAFRSATDSEVILAAFAEWGPACLDRFNGMWAFAIWDAAARELFLARDRFGVKPLHYVLRGDYFAFASEIKALVGRHGVPFAADGASVAAYVAYGKQPHPQGGSTYVDGVRALPPGWWMRVRADGAETGRYYDLRERAPAAARLPDDATRVAEFRELLTDAVRLRMRADVPLGSCLSGGLDSSSIVALVDRELRGTPGAAGNGAPRQRTFSAVYEEAARYNERPHMETMVRATHASAHFVVPTAEGLAADVDALVRAQDEPFGSTSIFAQWCVMRLARETGVTVLLDGQGADESLAGYQPFDVHVGELLRRGRVGRAARELRAAQAVAGVSPARTLVQGALWWLPVAARAAAARARSREGLAALRADVRARFADVGPRYQSRSTLAGYLYDQIEGGLPELLRYEDRNSMAFHIEARVPFVDFRVVEYCFRFADGLRIRDGWTKYLLRRAMHDALPESIAWRRDKVGFETPERAWMQALLRGRFTDPAEELRSAAWVEPDAFRRMVGAARTEGVTSRLLWRLINLELWLRSWEAGAAAAPRAPRRVLASAAAGA